MVILMNFFQKVKRKLKKGFSISALGLKFTFRVEKSGKPMLNATKQSQNSWQQPDNFKNDFRFNMFVEHALDVNVKKTIISQVYYKNIGRYPNIDDPKTLSEKVLWLKLYYEDPLITGACDKVKGKKYVDNVLGEGYTVPVIKEYKSVHDINLDELPEKFALKVNWATGCNYIVTDKKTIDMDKLRYTLDQWTLPWFSSYYGTFNKGYQTVKPIIFAEEYLDLKNNTTEYKVFCFNGRAEFTLIELDYFGGKPARAYYDRDWNKVPWQFTNRYKNKEANVTLGEMPAEYPEMLRLAEKLAEPFPYIRVDFYCIEGKLYVGELTFYSGGGLTVLEPEVYDKSFGEKLDITDAMKRTERKLRES